MESTSMDFWKKIYEHVEKNKHFFMLNSHYAYIPPYMNKTLPTLGNEKEQQQIKFCEKLFGKLIFSQATKNLKMFYFTHLTEQVLKK